MLQGFRFEVADITCMPMVDFILQLGAGDPDLLSVNHHDIVARIDVRGVLRLVLAAQAPGDLRREPPERFTAGVY